MRLLVSVRFILSVSVEFQSSMLTTIARLEVPHFTNATKRSQLAKQNVLSHSDSRRCHVVLSSPTSLTEPIPWMSLSCSTMICMELQKAHLCHNSSVMPVVSIWRSTAQSLTTSQRSQRKTIVTVLTILTVSSEMYILLKLLRSLR